MTVQRESDFWFVTAPDLPGVLTQVLELDDAETTIRRVVSMVLGVDPGSFDLALEVLE